MTPNFKQAFLLVLFRFGSADPVATLNHFLAKSGGADRDRTGDLLLAKQALSQLSYSPHK